MVHITNVEENKKVVMEPRFVLNPGPQYDSKPLQVFRRPDPPKINPNAKKIDFFAKIPSGSIVTVLPQGPPTVSTQGTQAPQAVFTPMASVVRKEGIY